ncbi:Metallo-beta-lactamase family protein [Halanaerobium saccharolyticum subsp. saccharolyticum DSM 6643]|uniref:Metallo-beta-lactamase family protein n=1 Tax=Halanaerobium saccharolyticum subsp. saccharolyticum DSM 6643 TaxID=1293054 RepID=M5EAN1_9FIRM|nr:rhodanese-like domain-containing protein [Halanaerobium saccharolyticum]CCU77803.1 Metallo-beta-lactamase family protein [Halanaerobium saccharolyticum subsp. saccharolyticum DSM 6643]
MLFEKIKSPGLAHISYLIGDKNQAVVIDPRRDIDIYLEKAVEAGYKITKIFETHRNEDYLIGSTELKAKTGAEIWHADQKLAYQYGNPVQDGQKFKVGSLKLEAMHTPGHTPGSMSYVLYGYEGDPWMVFTGDALFAGDVGRIDFLGEENLKKTGSWLYDSIFNKILPLGDEVILCPAHGAGSVCASAIAEREMTTVGIERKLNPKLQVDNKEEFIELVGKMLEYPPYFENMEESNLTGRELLANHQKPAALSAAEFAEAMDNEDTFIIDVRMEVSYASAHVPGSISIPLQNLPSFVGWFIPTGAKILLVTEGEYPEKAIRDLYRTGYDNILGYLGGGIINWHMAGKKSESVKTVTVDKLCNLLDTESGKHFILDIRSEDELEEEGEIQDAENIHLTQLPEHYDQLPEDKPIYIFCGSGLRSMTAASLLKNEGFINQKVVLGGLIAWNSTTCPIV